MVRRLVAFAGVVALGVAAGGCFSLDFDEDIRMIDHYGKELHTIRVLTNKYFFDFDTENPFED